MDSVRRHTIGLRPAPTLDFLTQATRVSLLLQSTDIPIKDVATLSGLTDQHSLTRLLRQYLDVTPGAVHRSYT
jgi:AraC-like DNA-binding protein